MVVRDRAPSSVRAPSTRETNRYFLRAKSLSALRILLVPLYGRPLVLRYLQRPSIRFSSLVTVFIYRTLSDQNRMVGNRYLCTDELTGEFSIQGQTVAVEENVFVHDALYPVTEENCDTFPALASLLLSNAARDQSVRHNSTTNPKDFGRPKKIKPGRPQIVKTTREEKQKSETNRYKKTEIFRRYTEKHPEGNRAAVRCYEDRHPGAGQDRVQVFRLMKPKIREFRHLPNSLARNIVAQGPMANWSSKLLCDMNAYKCKKPAFLKMTYFYVHTANHVCSRNKRIGKNGVVMKVCTT
ncbi:hypothetical protein J6590_005085 [Homalodisca vitripennis]|nr:hypothetical protein J6590_005085 [Homalodisca vitripennis]